VADRSHLSIGEVLSLLQDEFPDVTISKIRFLESQGLVDPERTPSGYRKFYEDDIERLRWVLRQQRDSFLPLKVIKGRLHGRGTDDYDDGDLAEITELPARPTRRGANGLEASAGAGSLEVESEVDGPARSAAPGASGGPGPHGGSPRAQAGTAGTPSIRKGQPQKARAAAGKDAATRGAGQLFDLGPPLSGFSFSSRALRGTGEPPSGDGPGGHGQATEAVPGREGAARPARGAGTLVGQDAVGRSGRGSATSAGRGDNVDDEPAGGVPATRESRSRPETTPPRPVGPARRRIGPPAEAGVAGPRRARPGETRAVADDDDLVLDELVRAAGVEIETVRDLERYGLISPKMIGGTAYYSPADTVIVRLAGAFARHGVEARHLRAYKSAAEREAGTVQQVIMPLIKQRNPEARRAAAEAVEELSELGGELRAALLRAALGDLH
jgi:DNA-binding transcriptional MerR regulator